MAAFVTQIAMGTIRFHQEIPSTNNINKSDHCT